jgi:predicted metal-dependent hydrolase
MSTRQHHITVSGLRVEVERKDIRNLHLGVHPPDGRVRVAAPLSLSDDSVRLAVISRLAWIKRQRARFHSQPRQSTREMVSGESHYFLGVRYRLRVIRQEGPPMVIVRGKSRIELYVPAEADLQQRERVLRDWHRRTLKELAVPLLGKWESILGVRASECRIKRMKTKWGTCSADAGRIWLNLELAKKPVQCIEYVMVHELAHLLERKHTDRFTSILDRHLPHWRSLRDELNATPLAYDRWGNSCTC